MKKAPIVMGCISALVMGGCQTFSEAENVQPLKVSFEWNSFKVQGGASGISPEIQISGTPLGAEKLLIHFDDLDNVRWNHGSNLLEKGQWKDLGNGKLVIPAGGIPHSHKVSGGYYGPGSTGKQNNRYRFTVKAITATDVIVAKGAATRNCCSQLSE